jgi:FtsP/CotA-like multicopper oxidase with cupredoxin domain
VRKLLLLLTVLALIGALGWYWQRSLLPDAYSVMDMGSTTESVHAGHDAVSVAELTGPQDRNADVTVALEARAETISIGEDELEGYTLNGTSPGPTIRARQGDLLEVRLTNANVAGGVALHWHGIDVPNAEDGVAGVTQDAVGVGEQHVYRFVVEDAGSYWYHSHQMSHEQVRNGLFGLLVVDPPTPVRGTEVLAAFHDYDGRRTVNGEPDTTRVDAAPDTLHRVRVFNTDNGPLRSWVVGAPYRVVSVDGRDVHRPDLVDERSFVVPGGGRYDIEITTPADGTAVHVVLGSTASSVVMGPPDAATPSGEEPEKELDLLDYGQPADIPFDTDQPDRDYDYRIGRRIGLLDGRPGMWWTVNGRLYPDVPMYAVDEGDVVRMTISNDSGDGHPMHLHGHHVLVLSRDGEPATGSPWWVDSLEVDDGESLVIAFVADNPGIWMDHCHNLPHAGEGLVAHVAYSGVHTPYLIGGDADNHPE